MPEDPVDPRSPQGWQEAVDLAEFYLLIESARAYGLITGGPVVNVERCEELLEKGRGLGYIPANDVAERHLPSVMGAGR